MLEIVNIFCWIALIVSLIFTVLHGWFVIECYDEDEKNSEIKKFLLRLVIFCVLCITTWYSQTRISLKESEAYVIAYEEYRTNQGDYIIEPKSNTEYLNAIKQLKYYEKLGIYKPSEVVSNVPEFKKPTGVKQMLGNKTGRNLIVEHPFVVWVENDKGELENLSNDEIVAELGSDIVVNNKVGKEYNGQVFVQQEDGHYERK